MNQSGIYTSEKDVKLSEHNIKFRLRASRMLDFDMMYAYLKRKLKLPSYFGKNLDALFDCLIDMSWFEDTDQFVIIIDQADKLLAEENKKNAEQFRQLLEDVTAEWKATQIEFIVIIPE